MLAHPMPDSLERWMRGDGVLAAFAGGEPPIGITLGAMDAGGLALGADVEQAFLAGNAQRVFSITH